MSVPAVDVHCGLSRFGSSASIDGVGTRAPLHRGPSRVPTLRGARAERGSPFYGHSTAILRAAAVFPILGYRVKVYLRAAMGKPAAHRSRLASRYICLLEEEYGDGRLIEASG
jgi:hypothetical protein